MCAGGRAEQLKRCSDPRQGAERVQEKKYKHIGPVARDGEGNPVGEVQLAVGLRCMHGGDQFLTTLHEEACPGNLDVERTDHAEVNAVRGCQSYRIQRHGTRSDFGDHCIAEE